MDLEYGPGRKSVYSDLGLILLGEILERVAGEALESFARERILEPLGMKDTRYRPAPALLPRIAPTERDPWRGRLVHGVVHDENAFALGGVAPHAGLFGTAPDLARFAQMLLNGGVLEHQRIVSRATVERFTRRAGVPRLDAARSAGTRRRRASSRPARSVAARVRPHRLHRHVAVDRPGAQLFVDPAHQPRPSDAREQPDPRRCAGECRRGGEGWRLRRRRVILRRGLVRARGASWPPRGGRAGPRRAGGRGPSDGGARCAASGWVSSCTRASVTSDGRHAVDVLRGAGSTSCASSRRSTASRGPRRRRGEGGERPWTRRAACRWSASTATKTKPAPEDLAGLDALVVDLQDAGVRFYTYA